MPRKRQNATDAASITEPPTKRVTRSSAKSNASNATSPTEQSKQHKKTTKVAHSGANLESMSSPKDIAVHSKINKSESTAQDATKNDAAPANFENLTIVSSLAKSPIECHLYTLSKQPSATQFLIFTHGAGGTLSAPAVQNFCTGISATIPVLAFQGSMNLPSRVKGFHACIQHLKESTKGKEDVSKGLLLGGRSMGARAAVMACTEILSQEKDKRISLILVSYPLKGPKDDIRDEILLNLPSHIQVLFVIGDRDAMCPLDMLDGVRKKMSAKSQLVVVKGADHGMHVKPASRDKEAGEESGSAAADWINGRLEGDVVYVNREDE